MSYGYIKVPVNLFYLMDANCTKVLITLIQMNEYCGKDGGFYRTMGQLELATGLSRNTIRKNLELLQNEGLVVCNKVDKQRYKFSVVTDNFAKYDKIPLDIIITGSIRLGDSDRLSWAYGVGEKRKEKQKPVKPATAKDAIFQYAKENRENPTPAESRFKNFLVKNKIAYKFQVPVCCEGEGYIIDFVIHSKSLDKDIAVEIDGGYHNKPDQVQKDKIREDNLKESGYVVVRFKNEETEKDAIYDVLFRKMNHIGAADILNKITIKKYLN